MCEVPYRAAALQDEDRVLRFGVRVGDVGLARLEHDVIHRGDLRAGARSDDQARLSGDQGEWNAVLLDAEDEDGHRRYSSIV